MVAQSIGFGRERQRKPPLTLAYNAALRERILMRVIQKALTFDDVLLLPAHSRVLPRDVSLKTRLTRKLELNLPLVSAAMDTVTEARLAIAIAQEGGIGIVHKNLTPQAQAAEVAKVKRFESGVLRDPMTVSPEMTVREVMALQREHRISGFPVVKAGKVVGIVTNRDLRFETNLDQPVKAIMTPQRRLITVREGASRDEAKELMHRHRLERVLVIDEEFHLKGLVTVKDITKETEHPNAAKDAQGKLRVGAAVGVGEGTDERVAALVEAGADVIVVDTAHGHAQGVLDRVKWIKTRYAQVQVVGGNVGTADGARDWLEYETSDEGIDSAVPGAREIEISGVRIDSLKHLLLRSFWNVMAIWVIDPTRRDGTGHPDTGPRLAPEILASGVLPICLISDLRRRSLQMPINLDRGHDLALSVEIGVT
jgi:IMP dehydrogenase/GMP reductase